MFRGDKGWIWMEGETGDKNGGRISLITRGGVSGKGMEGWCVEAVTR